MAPLLITAEVGRNNVVGVWLFWIHADHLPLGSGSPTPATVAASALLCEASQLCKRPLILWIRDELLPCHTALGDCAGSTEMVVSALAFGCSRSCCELALGRS